MTSWAAFSVAAVNAPLTVAPLAIEASTSWCSRVMTPEPATATASEPAPPAPKAISVGTLSALISRPRPENVLVALARIAPVPLATMAALWPTELRTVSVSLTYATEAPKPSVLPLAPPPAMSSARGLS